MAFFTTSSRPPPAPLYPDPSLHYYPQNIVSPAPESPMPIVWPWSLSQYDSNIDSVALPLEPNKKRHIESIGEPGGGSFLTSSSKRPRILKRPKNAARKTPGFACPLYK